MSILPPGSSMSVPAAQGLAGLSVRLRLRLLLAGLVLMFLCSGALFAISQQQNRAAQQIAAEVRTTLDTLQASAVVQRSLIDLRRALVVVAAFKDDQGVIAEHELTLAQHWPAVATSLETLRAFQPAATITVRRAAEDIVDTARKGAEALARGDRDAGAAIYRRFAVVGAPADAALEALMQNQQASLRGLLIKADAARARAAWLTLALHLTLLMIGLAAVIFLLKVIFQPLQKLYRGLDLIARGKVLHEPPVSGGDEFGQLGTALADLSKITSQLNTVAFNDALTGLANRAQFERDLVENLARGQSFALLFADIDHFRTINDGYGYQFGDQVLAAVARRLKGFTGREARLYRYGGDLFAISLAIVEGQESFRTVTASEAERLRLALAEPLSVAGRQLPLCLSFGVALFPEDGASPETLAGAADAALHQAKRMGRNNVQYARGDYTSQARRRLELADDLRIALTNGAVTPHFQPIVDLGAGHVVCAEALARWKHPKRGFVPPDEFIAIAEASGQIDALTHQLLTIACRTATQWKGTGHHPPPKLAFNLSARQVRQGVVEMIAGVLAETGLPASRLEVEITETAMIERAETAERLLRELKELGVSVALDDFGTGYSSLSYLLRFPIDKIKVDRSFVAQLQGQQQAGKIVGATIALANSLDITLVAEGVENLGQMVTLYELGCRQQQGWLFSKALPQDDFSRWALHAPLKLDAVVRAQAEAANEEQAAA